MFKFIDWLTLTSEFLIGFEILFPVSLCLIKRYFLPKKPIFSNLNIIESSLVCNLTVCPKIHLFYLVFEIFFQNFTPL